MLKYLTTTWKHMHELTSIINSNCFTITWHATMLFHSLSISLSACCRVKDISTVYCRKWSNPFRKIYPFEKSNQFLRNLSKGLVTFYFALLKSLHRHVVELKIYRQYTAENDHIHFEKFTFIVKSIRFLRYLSKVSLTFFFTKLKLLYDNLPQFSVQIQN